MKRLCLGILIGALAALNMERQPLMVGLAVALVCIGMQRSGGRFQRGLVPMAFGALLGGLVASVQALAWQRSLPTAPCTLAAARGEVLGLPGQRESSPHGARQSFLFRLDPDRHDACLPGELVRVVLYDGPEIGAGERWQFRLRLKPPWGAANPAGSDPLSQAAHGGVAAYGSAAGKHAVALGSPPSMAGRIARWRERHSAAIAEPGRSARTSALLKALLVGDTRAMPASLWERLRALGITHLFVISGLHVSLVAGLAFIVARSVLGLCLPGARPWLLRTVPAVSALAAALLYALLAGFGLPLRRALLMLALMAAGRCCNRPLPPELALLLTAALLVLTNPFEILQPSLWLSAGAVAWLIWLARWQPRLTTLWVHSFMCLAMVPLSLAFFRGISVLGPLGNWVLTPIIAVVVVPLGLLALLLGEVVPVAGSALLSAAALPLDLWGWFGAGGDVPGWLRLEISALRQATVLTAVVLLPLPLGMLSRLTLGGLVVAALASAQGASAALRSGVTIFDVGHGTAVLIQDGGRALLFDTGGGFGDRSAFEHRVEPLLRRAGIRQLDALIVSHGDQDHSAGAARVAAEFDPVRQLSGQPLPALPGARRCRPGQAWQWSPKVRFQVLAGGWASSDNDSSCVLLVDLHGWRFLLPGDISQQRERELVEYWRERLAADVLLLSHHGSSTSSSSAFLRAVAPGLAVATAARWNHFGHPHPSVVDRLARRQVPIFATGNTGALVFRVDDRGGLQLRQWRHSRKRFWHPSAPVLP